MSDEATKDTKPADKPANQFTEPEPVTLVQGWTAVGSETPKLNAALVAAVKGTPWVEFTKPEKGGGISYEYLSEEDIVKALRKVLPEHGLSVVPRKMTLVSKEIYNSRSGGRMVNLLINVQYRVCHVSGEYIDGEAFGEGSDSGDKAANKAMTGAYKYFLRELTMIAGGLDPDRTSSDELARAAKPPKGAPAPQQAANKGGQTQPQKPTKTLDQRLTDALAHVAKLNSHADIKKAAKQAPTVKQPDGTTFNQAQLAKIYNACATRATLLFTAAVGKAADLEAIDAIVKEAEADKIGTENLAKLKKAAEARSTAIVGDGGGPDPDAGDGPPDDEPEPLDF